MKKALLFSFATLFFFIVKAQTTYTWVGGTSGAYGTSSNWSPARTSPAINDILVIDFNNATAGTAPTTPTATAINISGITANETIGELRLSITGTISTTGVRILTFSGTATTLNITNDLTLNWYTSASYTRIADGGNTINVGGNLSTGVAGISASSTLHTGIGKIVFTGATPTFCTPASSGGNVNLQNIEISSSTTLTLQAILGINGDLRINSGGILIQNGRGLVFQASNGSGGTISGNGTITGSTAGAITIQNSGTGNSTPITFGTLNFTTTSSAASTINSLTISRANVTVNIGTAFNNTLTIQGTIALNGGTLNDGGNVINVGGGSMFSTTNTTVGGAVHTGTGRINYTRANTTAPSFFTSSTATAVIAVGNITWAPNSSSTTNPVFNSGTALVKVLLNGAFTFVRNASGSPTLTLSNTDSLIVGPSGSITIPTGLTLDFNSRPVLFQASATSSARLGTITGQLNNASNVTVERYIPQGKRAFRLLTPMVTTSGAIYANWQNGGTLTNNLGTHITGSTTGANGFDQTTTGNVSLFTYDNSGGTWTGISNTNVNTLSVGVGYRLLVRGDRRVDISSTSTSQANMNDYTVLRTTGTVVNGTGVAPADPASGGVLPTLNTTVGNFSLVGNPFISPVDWHTVTRSGLEDTYYAWDPNMGTAGQRGRYVSYSIASGFNNLGNSGSSNVGRYIQPGQAFFVKTTGATPSITIKEADKASTFASVFRTQTGVASLTVNLFEPSEVASGAPIDGATALFGNNFINGIGKVEKLATNGENISFIDGAKFLMIHALQNVTANDSLHLQITSLGSSTNNYAFKINAADFANDQQAFLVDKYLQTTQALNLSGITTINFSTNSSIAASSAANRFSIVFKNNGALPVNFTGIKAYQKNNNIQVDWTVANEINLLSYEVEKSIDGVTFNKIGSVAASASNLYSLLDAQVNNGNNYYRVKAISKNNAVQYSAIVNVKMGKDNNVITLVSNPVRNGNIQLQLEKADKGTYAVKLFNEMGQLVSSQSFVHAGGSASETISVQCTKGIYQLNIIKPDGSMITKPVMID